MLGWMVGALQVASAAEPTLLFKSEFDPETRVVAGRLLNPAPNSQHLAGRDRVTGFDWGESLQRVALVNDAFFQYVIAPDAKPETFVANFDAPRETPWGTLPAGWWVEGEAAGARARVEDGHLLLDATAPASPGATLWLDRELPRDAEVAFDVHVVDAVGAANNMNLLFQFRDPKSPGLRETRAERADGKYSRYHSERLTGTILTFLANGSPEQARVRVRQVPPFEPVVQEFNGYHARQDRTYHVRVARRGDRFTCFLDGQKVLDSTLPPEAPGASGGYLGFRTWHTKLWWDNVVIRRPTFDREKPE
jgi:hypothetical protein